MSYVEQTWQTGDTVTAEKLNHMEAGIAGAVGSMVLTETETPDTPSPGATTYTLNKTWQEIYDAIIAGIYVGMVVEYTDGGHDYTQFEMVYSVSHSNDYGYQVHTSTDVYTASTANDYPAREA